MFLNDISENISSSICVLAYDCIAYRPISNSEDSIILQKDLAQLGTHMADVSKCVLLRVTRNNSPFISKYTLNSLTIQLYNLGVVLIVCSHGTLSLGFNFAGTFS